MEFKPSYLTDPVITGHIENTFKQHYQPLGSDNLDLIIQNINEPKNKLFGEYLWPYLYWINTDESMGFDIGTMDQTEAEQSYYLNICKQPSEGYMNLTLLQKREAELKGNKDHAPSIQSENELFTNYMRFQSLPGVSQYPKYRSILGGFVVFTVEFDPKANVVQTLSGQMDLVRNGSVDRLFDKLSANPFFRMLTLVYSGSKSIHYHALYQTCVSSFCSPDNPEYGHEPDKSGYYDVTGSSWGKLIRGNPRSQLMKSWDSYEDVVKTVLGLYIPSDSSLSQPERHRRLPWGIRTLNKPNVFGLSGDVPQVVIYEKKKQ